MAKYPEKKHKPLKIGFWEVKGPKSKCHFGQYTLYALEKTWRSRKEKNPASYRTTKLIGFGYLTPHGGIPQCCNTRFTSLLFEI